MVIWLGKVLVVLSDALERTIREAVVRRLGGKKGDLSKAAAEAFELWLKTEPTIELLAT